MEDKRFYYLELTHAKGDDTRIAVRADRIVLVEDLGEFRMVSVMDDDAFMCKESFDDIMEMLREIY